MMRKQNAKLPLISEIDEHKHYHHSSWQKTTLHFTSTNYTCQLHDLRNLIQNLKGSYEPLFFIFPSEILFSFLLIARRKPFAFLILAHPETLSISIPYCYCYIQPPMKNDLLRLYHQTIPATHLEDEPYIHASLLWFLVSYLPLVVVAILYLGNPIDSSFVIPASPPERQRRFLFVLAISIMGAIGLYSVIEDFRGLHEWIHYAIFNLLFAAFIFAYQTSKDTSLIISCILMECLAVGSYWLFYQTSHNWMIHILAGAVEGWTNIWFLHVLGQVMVYECDLSRKFQNVCFFVAGIVGLVFAVFWHMFRNDSLQGMIGYVALATILLLLFYRNYQKSLDSVL